MDISGMAASPPSNTARTGDSFTDSLRKEGGGPQPAFTAMKSSAAGDLAAGLGSVSPDFTPALGDGIFEAIGLGEGAVDEMRRFEEKMNDR